jgi:FkbM family methyltransferase
MRKTVERNGRQNVSVFENLVGDREGPVAFTTGKDVQGASVLTSLESSPKVQQVTLDGVQLLRDMDSTHTVLMIDVEGYEPEVLRGGRMLVERVRPLVVFEYNWVSKQHFNLADVQAILGDDYQIFRLRKDALLDTDVENAWNCVAVPRGTDFEKVLKAKLYAAA